MINTTAEKVIEKSVLFRALYEREPEIWCDTDDVRDDLGEMVFGKFLVRGMLVLNGTLYAELKLSSGWVNCRVIGADFYIQ